MKRPFTPLGLASVAAFAFAISAQAVSSTYNGNGQTDFDGAVGSGSLMLSSNGTTLTGTITNGNSGAGFNDTLVLYIDSVAGGFTSTATFADAQDGSDNLRASVSGSNGSTRATLNFAPGFGADYAIALGPNSASFGGVFALDNVTNFTYQGSANLTPLNGTSGTYTFSLPLSEIGSPTSFSFVSTYLNGGTASGNSTFRSFEGYANTLVDTQNPANNPGTPTTNIGTDTATATAQTFPAPEPRAWAMIIAGLGALIGLQRQFRRA